MFVCGDCGAVFDAPLRTVERHGLDTPPYEALEVCPSCYGVCILSAMYCDGCGGVITGKYIQLDDEGTRYCENCYTVREIDDRS